LLVENHVDPYRDHIVMQFGRKMYLLLRFLSLDLLASRFQ
jgi:hypothetical protein